jgi:hypothetical protein
VLPFHFTLMKKLALLPGLIVSASAFAGLLGADVKIPSVPAQPAAPTTANAAASVTDFTQLSAKLVEQAKSLLANPQLTAPMKEQLTKLTDGILGNRDGVASDALAKLVSLKPSADQMGVVKELQTNFGVLALGRDFDPKDPASEGPVKQTIEALKAKDTASIVAGLQKLGTQAKLSDSQKQIVANLLGSYNAKLVGAVDKVNSATTKLKSFGL